jgi:hypothetical protein
MEKPTIEELQHENAALRERVDRLRQLLDNVAEPRTMLDVVGPETRSRIINALSPAEIGPHLRELALRCIRLARLSTEPEAVRELEDVSIELADRAASLAAIFTVPSARK